MIAIQATRSGLEHDEFAADTMNHASEPAVSSAHWQLHADYQSVSPVSAATGSRQQDFEKSEDDLKVPAATAFYGIQNGSSDGPQGGGVGFEPMPCRSSAWGSYWGHLSLDALQILLVIPFIALGIIVLAQNGTTTSEALWVPDIVSAATYGPTVFPIIFSVVVGRFMKAIAYFKLERRTTVETMEQLQGSRTVVSAITTQIQLHSFNLLAIGIVLLWALSPVGSQASLRVASIVRVTDAIGFDLSYLDVRNNYSPNDYGFSNQLAGAMLTSSLMMPARTLSDPFDQWGNVRIPMIEDLEGSSPSLNWISTEDRNVSYASLIGIPMTVNSTLEAVPGMNVSFTVDTSYWWLDCHTEQVKNDSYSFPDPRLINYTAGASTTRMAWSTLFRKVGPGDPAAFPLNQSMVAKVPGIFPWEPRRVYLLANNSQRINSTFVATCNLTTTFVTVNATCSGSYSSQFASTVLATQRCRATAVRRSRLNATESTVSMLDIIGADRDALFLSNFVNSTTVAGTGVARQSALTPNVGYLASPGNAFKFETDYPDWSGVSARDFGSRLARMLNTYWIAAVGYKPVQGEFHGTVLEGDSGADPDGQPPSTDGGLNGAGFRLLQGRGVADVPRDALVANLPWTAVLFVTSVVLLGAASATLALNLMRRAPSGLDNFATIIKDSPHAHVVVGGQRWPMTLASMVGGFDRARLIKDVVVQIGDVAPGAQHGYVAIATPETVATERLRRGRTYL